MSWTVGFLEEHGTVETVYAGPLTTSELREAILATVASAKGRGVKRFLSDCTGVDTSNGRTLVDLYELPALYDSLGVDRAGRQAMVFPPTPGGETELAFYETVMLNRGYAVRIFPSREEALGWLTGEREEPPASPAAAG